MIKMTKSKSIHCYNELTLKKWLENKNTRLIDTSLIELTEPAHMNAKPIEFTDTYLEKYNNQDSITHKIIVRRNGEAYSLVIGYKWFLLALILNKPIACVVVSEYLDRYKFLSRIGWVFDKGLKMPDGTDMIYPIHKVKIPKRLRNSIPREEKYKKYEKYFTKHGTIDKPISVIQDKYNSSKVVLQNEYIRFLILRNHNVKNIPVKFIK